MTAPQPPEPQGQEPRPVSPEFAVPRMSQVPANVLDSPEFRKRRMRLGIIGAVVGFAVNVLILVVAVVLGGAADGSGADQWIGMQLVLFGGLILAAPVQIVLGIILAAVHGTRPFGVGFLIGSAVGIIVMAGACFAPLALDSSTY
jgi:hypothetical protein